MTLVHMKRELLDAASSKRTKTHQYLGNTTYVVEKHEYVRHVYL